MSANCSDRWGRERSALSLFLDFTCPFHLLAWLSTHLPVPPSSKATPTSLPVPLPSAIAQIHTFSPSGVVMTALSVARPLVIVELLLLIVEEMVCLVFVDVLLCMLLTDAEEDVVKAELMRLLLVDEEAATLDIRVKLGREKEDEEKDAKGSEDVRE